MPTQASPYSLVRDLRDKAERLRMQEVRQAVKGSIAAHSITADKLVVGTLFVGGPEAAGSDGDVPVDPGAVVGLSIRDGAITAAKIQAGSITGDRIAAKTLTADEIAVGTVTNSEIADGTITGVEIADGTVTAAKLTVMSLSAISANLGTVTAGTINGVTINLGSGLPHVTGDSTGIKAIGDGASYRFFGDTSGSTASRTGAVRCNLPTISGTDFAQVELDAYTGWAHDGDTSAAIRVRNGGSDAEQGFVKVFGNGNVSGSSAYVNASDRRLKRSIRDVSGPLEVVARLRPRTFTRKLSGLPDAGFVAQEVQRVLPELVHESDFDGKPRLGIAYDGIHAYTVGAIQELVRRVEALERS